MLAITPPWCDSPTPPNWLRQTGPAKLAGSLAVRSTYPCAAHLAQVKAVELSDVLSDDLALLYLADVLEVAFDNVARMWPGRGGVGVVGRPHHVVHPDPVPAGNPEGVIDERAVHLASEVFAGLQGQLCRPRRHRTGWAEAREAPVHALQIVRQPAAVILGRDDLQAWEPFQHAGEDEDAKGFLDFVGGNRLAQGA